jgi:outer membrane protein OmpA-like peptidoglycan-associated protein
MNRTFYAIIVLQLLFIPVFSQRNLVINPDFETYEECPRSHNPENKSHKIIPGWTYPTWAASDYFNACSSLDAGIPENFAGNSEAHSGVAYVGAILSGTSESRREYIQGELKNPMVAGEKYCVSFFYKLASGSRFAVDQLSIYFSDKRVLTEGNEAMSLSPEFSNIDGLFLDNIEDWNRACYLYTAKGEEQFFIIGNFKNYSHTNYVITDKNVVNQRNKAYAYYYFDDVSIFPLENCNDCPCVQHDFEAAVTDTFYTGGADPVTGKTKELVNNGRIKLAMMGGTEPYSVTWSNGATGTFLKNLPAGKYTYYAQDNVNCLDSGTVVFKAPEVIEDNFMEGLKNIEEGAAIVLENIFFEYNETTLLPESYQELDQIVQFLKEGLVKKIEISGHTDSDGSESYNKKLSEGRAQSVVNYIVSKGINDDILVAVGYGESRPIDTNLSEEGKAKNRRVEFKVLKK